MQGNEWTSRWKVIVEKLLEESEAESRHYVESKKFRKRNYADIGDIEVLVRRGFILDKNYQYSVNVLCFPQLESVLASKIRSDADSLWNVYRSHYLESDNDSVFLSVIAKDSGLEMDDAQRAMHYMMQTNWHRGYATPADGLYNSVVIGEEVLKYPSFSEYLTDLYEQYTGLLRIAGPFGAPNFLHEAQQNSSGLQALVNTNLPAWVSELPEDVRELLKETFLAKEQGWNRLTAMGIRTLFDMVSMEALTRDAKTFKAKLDAMVSEEHIAPTQQENLDAMVEAGHAAAHRGFNPTPEMVDTMWGIALNVLESFYVLKPRARKLKGDTPPRASRIKP